LAVASPSLITVAVGQEEDPLSPVARADFRRAKQAARSEVTHLFQRANDSPAEGVQ
jgi:hypothetical protein